MNSFTPDIFSTSWLQRQLFMTTRRFYGLLVLQSGVYRYQQCSKRPPILKNYDKLTKQTVNWIIQQSWLCYTRCWLTALVSSFFFSQNCTCTMRNLDRFLAFASADRIKNVDMWPTWHCMPQLFPQLEPSFCLKYANWWVRLLHRTSG